MVYPLIDDCSVPFLREMTVHKKFTRRRRIKSKFSYFLFEHPNILRTSDELSWSDLSSPRHPRWKKSGHESSSEVCQMMGCSNKKHENFDFIRRRLLQYLKIL